MSWFFLFRREKKRQSTESRKSSRGSLLGKEAKYTSGKVTGSVRFADDLVLKFSLWSVVRSTPSLFLSQGEIFPSPKSESQIQIMTRKIDESILRDTYLPPALILGKFRWE